MKLDTKFKKIWLEALRSGKYKQAKGQLRRGDAFCCLGVACDVFQKKIHKKGNMWDSNEVFHYKDSVSRGFVPFRLAEKIGLDYQYELVNLNDNQGKSFSEIADYMEKNL